MGEGARLRAENFGYRSAFRASREHQCQTSTVATRARHLSFGNETWPPSTIDTGIVVAGQALVFGMRRIRIDNPDACCVWFSVSILDQPGRAVQDQALLNWPSTPQFGPPSRVAPAGRAPRAQWKKRMNLLELLTYRDNNISHLFYCEYYRKIEVS